MDSDSGDFIGRGSSRSFAPDNATITATGSESGVQFKAVSDGSSGHVETWNAAFNPGNESYCSPNQPAPRAPPAAGVGTQGPGPTMEIYETVGLQFP